MPAPQNPNHTRFEAEIGRYNQWREELTQSVHEYHDWLESNGHLDVQQSIRFYDLLENLNKGRLLLAFLAEFSRGKSELINALFFSNFKERLLPSDVGRTTMCPTEIFHDPTEEPYLKLLSVETRYRDESISQLKNMPVEWSKIRLNTNSTAEMQKALAALAETKKVYALEARMLGLSPMLNENGELPGEEELVEVPAWRYAMINYPHPLLSNGLSILDTPGLNALGMEPELTVSTIPSAHAVLFLLSIDTGVTKSDLEIWDRYVRPGLPQKIAVLNKIDLMWDELKTPPEIDRAITRMVDTTGAHLNLPRERIFPISAQKALLGKIRDDPALVKKSGIEQLERFMADEIVPMKRSILCKAVVSEIGGMMSSSRALVAKKQESNLAAVAELQGLQGKSRDVVTKLWQKITAEKNAYNTSLAEYKVNSAQFNAKRAALMDRLNPAHLDQIMGKSEAAMEKSWTTVGLQRSMREMSRLMSEDFETVFVASEDIKKMMQGVYNTFIQKFGFQKMTLPSLDLDPQRTKLKLLVHEAEAFSRDPVNVAHYTGPFIKKFYNTIVKQARLTFTDAKTQADRWVQAVIMPLETQMKDHKQLLQSRLDNLSKINEKTTTINEQMAELKKVEADLKKQRDMIEGLISRVSASEGRAPIPDMVGAPLARPDDTITPEMMQTARMAAAGAQKAAPAPAPVAAVPSAPKPAPSTAQPMIASDDLLAQLAAVSPTESVPSAVDRMQETQRLALGISGIPEEIQRTQRTKPSEGAGMMDTQRLAAATPPPAAAAPVASTPAPAAEPERTQRIPNAEGDKTVQIAALDPNWRPPVPGTEVEKDATTTQRLDNSIQRLQEAKRLLQNLKS
ncbi:hypothetical protein DSM104443_00140 [Usitatibacter rugosus]|uniref:Dynamin N-terminal domain-containing protein n=1 Tax=Usitatibacter rugosus TaxID=2732067 RepID=A0A6M4GRL2_9PROT|nr:dynamin family protein [Usitatibacter rugosus]QJR09104.1 hypothetical protein DSM104443_00140 [Usitatibacter rugosus]